MPTYTFYCNKCKCHDDYYLPITKRNEQKLCVRCDVKMIRLIGTGESIIFKGDGWPGRDIKQKKDCAKKVINNLRKQAKKQK